MIDRNFIPRKSRTHRSIRRGLTALALIVSLWAHPLSGQPVAGGAPGLPLAPELAGLGSLEYPVTTSSPAAQRFFNQGLRLLYAFNHDESRRAFTEAARLDPNLAMAYWGQAMALGPNLNAPMTPENGRLAYQAVGRAQAASRSASRREHGLIAAAAARFAADGAGDRRALDQAYAAAMARLARQYPG